MYSSIDGTVLTIYSANNCPLEKPEVAHLSQTEEESFYMSIITK